jgi:bifunctional pyridoxal-dependent enzyme with beta-cystathionase and maltose regulon repressor activities
MGIFSLLGNKWVLIGVAAVVAIGMGYLYFSWSQAELAELNQKLAQQEQQIEIQQATLAHITSRMATIEEANRRFDLEVKRIRIQTGELAKFFNSELLSTRAKTEPTAVERQVNEKLWQFFTDLEQLSRGEKP